MKNNFEYKLQIKSSKKIICEINLAHAQIQEIVSLTEDNIDNDLFFKYCATHSSSSVRLYTAFKHNLSQETFNILSNDNSIDVLRRLINSNSAKKYATQEQLSRWINLDVELAKNIAETFEEFARANIEEIFDSLIKCSDPEVLIELTQNKATPRKYLKLLAKHTDPSISTKATNNLAN